MGFLISVVISCLISAILYRAGGMGKELDTRPKWIPMWLRQSWVRDWLCPGVLLILILLNWKPHDLTGWLMILPYYGLSGGALSTYWDWLFKGKDNFYMHGLGCSLAMLPLIAFVPWWIILLHGIICTTGMGRWSEQEGTDWIEEMGRGIFFII